MALILSSRRKMESASVWQPPLLSYPWQVPLKRYWGIFLEMSSQEAKPGLATGCWRPHTNFLHEAEPYSKHASVNGPWFPQSMDFLQPLARKAPLPFPVPHDLSQHSSQDNFSSLWCPWNDPFLPSSSLLSPSNAAERLQAVFAFPNKMKLN